MTRSGSTKSDKIDGSNATEISRSVERIIREGSMLPGDTLPSVRSLAEELGVSPTTVNAAYRTLRTRGLLVGGRRKGTRVSAAPPVTRRLTTTIPPGVLDLATDCPDPTQIPSVGPVLDRLDWSGPLLDEDNDPGVIALAKAQFEADGIAVSSPAIMANGVVALERALDAQVRFGDKVLVEDPCSAEILDMCRTLGLNPVPVAVDSQGPELVSFEAGLESGVRAAIVSVRAQDPTSATLSKKRATALKKALGQHPEVFVIEYDRVGECAESPLYSVHANATECWVAIRSLTYALGSSLSLCAVTGDSETLGRIEGRLRVGGQLVSPVLQRIVLGFFTDAQAMIIEAVRETYARRREALVESLKDMGIQAWGESGQCVWVPVPEEYPVAQSLRDHGWAVMPGERFRIQSPPGIRIVTASLPERDAERLAETLASVLRG